MALPEIIQKLNVSMEEGDNMTKLLNTRDREMYFLINEEASLHKTLSEIKEANSVAYEHLQEITYEWEMQHKQITIFETMAVEKKQMLEKETIELEGIHENVWQERSDFCDRVWKLAGEFTHSHTAPRPAPAKVEESDTEARDLEVATLETKWEGFGLEVTARETEAAHKRRAITSLTTEPTSSEEFIILNGDLQRRTEEVGRLEEECKALERQLQNASQRAAGEGEERRLQNAPKRPIRCKYMSAYLGEGATSSADFARQRSLDSLKERRMFVVKTPSTVSRKLQLQRDRTRLLHQQMAALLATSTGNPTWLRELKPLKYEKESSTPEQLNPQPQEGGPAPHDWTDRARPYVS